MFDFWFLERVIRFCCLKLFSLWGFVIGVLGFLYSYLDGGFCMVSFFWGIVLFEGVFFAFFLEVICFYEGM